MVPQISPAEIGLQVDYDSKTWRPWVPDKWVVHYGGNWNQAGYPPFTAEKEMRVLRGWEAYHLRRMRGIAYNYGIGQTGSLYRLRGENASGATSGDEDGDGIAEYYEARAVVFILGGHQIPSDAALQTFADFWAEDPMRVIGHRDSTATPCPGEYLYEFVTSKRYEEMTEMPSIEEIRQAVREEAGPAAILGAQFGGPVGSSKRKSLAEHILSIDAGWRKIAAGAVGGATATQIVNEIAHRLGG